MHVYDPIFEPLTVRGMTVKNRVVMSPMATNFAGVDGSVTQEQIDYYAMRARGGVGLIIIENACVDYPLGTNGATQLRIDNDTYMPGLYKLTEALHSYGARACLQINHAGSVAYLPRLDGAPQVSASDIPGKKGGTIPRPLERAEILSIVKRFGEAANRAKRAGFDCVEVHAGHNYLLNQFMSPIFNKRTDEFGGSKENLARFIKMTMEEVRADVGPDFPIAIRLSVEEFLDGGNSLDDSLEIMEYFISYADIVDVSAGINDSIHYHQDTMSMPDGWRSFMSKAVKERFNVPVMASGNIRDPAIARKILEDNDADFLCIGRGLIAEPNWAQKIQTGNEHQLRNCISCNIGCIENRVVNAWPIRCSVNPDVVYEDAYKNQRAKHRLSVVVIGGGVAGLEAACSAAELGCGVTLFEKKPSVGGLVAEIAQMPLKKRIGEFTDYLAQRASMLPNLDILLNKKADVDAIKQERPDIIVYAAGGKPLLPRIEGLHDALQKPDRKVFTIVDLLTNPDAIKPSPDDRIAVAGGGAVGLDVVEHFIMQGIKNVRIIEMLPALGRDLDYVARVAMAEMIEKNNIDVNCETTLVGVGDGYFDVTHNDVPSRFEFDYGFICLGMASERGLLDSIEAYAKENNIELLNIGDSLRARKIISGTREGRDVIAVIKKVDSNMRY